MNIIKKEIKLCVNCMETHEVCLVEVKEKTKFKNEEIEYIATYEYCSNTDELFMSEELISKNDIQMKNAYRSKMGLLTTYEINAIRYQYGISQSDLSTLLGWGEKTITRYEGHHVQDVAHDKILRKISKDYEWYLNFLEESKHSFSDATYKKYKATALNLYETQRDEFLRKSIYASYAKYNDLVDCNGGKKIDLDKIVDIVRYLANSCKVKSLYKVKLMKMLWYIDALSYKSTGSSMTGLVYKSQPMGALPISHELIIDLKGINYEEIDFGEGTGYHFIADNNNEYSYITPEEQEIIDEIIENFGGATRTSIIESMHKEVAYTETALHDIIQYKYAMELSI